jgi:aspartate/methionine/tyrosine aminotransferase
MFDTDGAFNLNGLREHLEKPSKNNKKIVILNFPNNPTGYTVTTEEAHHIRDLLVSFANKGTDIVVFIDDAYFGLVFEKGIFEESIFSLLCDAHERIIAVKFDGPTKEDYVWGFRVGFVTFGCARSTPQFYAALEAKIGGAIRGTISNASNISQSLLLKAYIDPLYEQEKQDKYAILKRRYEKILAILNDHPEYTDYFSALPFNSGYFMCVKIATGDAESVRMKLLDKYSTGVIAQGAIIRIAFSSVPVDSLDLLFDNLYHAAQDVLTPVEKHV